MNERIGLLLIHAFPADAAMWERQVADLSAPGRTRCFDNVVRTQHVRLQHFFRFVRVPGDHLARRRVNHDLAYCLGAFPSIDAQDSRMQECHKYAKLANHLLDHNTSATKQRALQSYFVVENKNSRNLSHCRQNPKASTLN